MSNLFEKSGAEFSTDRKHRFSLYRIWNESRAFVMFIGLNPSTANEIENDPTIKSVTRIAKFNGFGGVYMLNLWPGVATKPEDLIIDLDTTHKNNWWLHKIKENCETVVFAWGNFKIVKDQGRDKEMIAMFPEAKAISINNNGSPKHPLYCRTESRFIDFRK